MNVHALLSMFAIVAGGIDEGQSSPNNGAGVAGFVLLLVWIIIIFVVQVLRRRRRRAAMGGDGEVQNSTSSPGIDSDHQSTDTP